MYFLLCMKLLAVLGRQPCTPNRFDDRSYSLLEEVKCLVDRRPDEVWAIDDLPPSRTWTHRPWFETWKPLKIATVPSYWLRLIKVMAIGPLNPHQIATQNDRPCLPSTARREVNMSLLNSDP